MGATIITSARHQKVRLKDHGESLLPIQAPPRTRDQKPTTGDEQPGETTPPVQPKPPGEAKVLDTILTEANIRLPEITPDIGPFDADSKMLRLGIEAMRPELAPDYDGYISLSIACVDPPPHRLEAVDDYFLRPTRIRFLLADDPGTGNTITTALPLKELSIHIMVKRSLIVTPASQASALAPGRYSRSGLLDWC